MGSIIGPRKRPEEIMQETAREHGYAAFVLGMLVPTAYYCLRVGCATLRGRDWRRVRTSSWLTTTCLCLASFYLGSKFGGMYYAEMGRVVDYQELTDSTRQRAENAVATNMEEMAERQCGRRTGE